MPASIVIVRRMVSYDPPIRHTLLALGYGSLGGLVFNHLGDAPNAGERIQMETVEIKVRRVVRARVQQVELRVKTPLREEEVA